MSETLKGKYFVTIEEVDAINTAFNIIENSICQILCLPQVTLFFPDGTK